MFAKILAFLLLASPLMAVRVSTVVVQDTSVVKDTYIRGFSDSLNNFGKATILPVNSGTRALFKFLNLGSALGNRELLACSLVVQTANVFYNTASGTLSLYKMLTDWEEGEGFSRTGALWRYSQAPLMPDTVPQSSLPSSFSWADSNLTADAKNQYGCGSCYIFGAAAALEDALMIQGGERQLSYNAGNGTGSDRSGTNYSLFPVTTEEAGNWRIVQLPTQPLADSYASSTNECGWTLIRQSGTFTLKTSECADAAYRPRIFVPYVIDSVGTRNKTKSVTGATSISETVLKSGADSTTNFGSDTSFTINSTNTTFLIKINDVHTLFGDSVTTFTDAVYCSLYVQSISVNGGMWATRSLKKWVEGEATHVNWKTSNRWGEVGGLKPNSYDLSEQYSLNCDASQSCSGGDLSAAYKFWLANGVVEEANIPYEANDALSCADTTGVTEQLLKWYWSVNYSTPGRIKQRVINRPVSVLVEDFTATGSDCYVGASSSREIDHTFIVIGWDDNYTCGDSAGAFIVRNSHGTDWGDGGIGYVSYNNNSMILMTSGSDGAYIPETVTSPIMWNAAGTRDSVDVAATPMSTVSVTTAEFANYKFGVDTTLVRQWINGGDNFGLMLQPTDVIFENNAVVGIGASESPGTPVAKPYLVLYTRGTLIGNTKMGNVKIGE